MTDIDRNAIMPYSSTQMYNLICDINSYPKFLPWCVKSKILQQDKTSVQAKIWIKKSLIETSFATKNELIPNTSVKMSLIEGPFDFLDGNWEFITLNENACKIEFKLSYRFANRAFSLALKPIFNQIGDKMLDSFCERAHQIYKKK